MKVLLLTQYFTPEPVEKFADLARALVERGHEVEVLTGFPCYPQGKTYAGYQQKLCQQESVDGYTVTRVPQRPDHSASIWRRALYYLSFACSAATIGLMKVRRDDVILVYQSALPVGLAAWFISRVRRIPYVLDVADLWPESVTASGMLKNRGLIWLIKLCARFVYRGAARISVITQGYRDNLLALGVPAEKIDVIHYWVPVGQYDAVERDEQIAQQYGMTGRFNLVYAGAMGPCQQLETVLAAAGLLRELPEVQFLLIGDGVESELLKTRAKDMNLANVRFLGRLPAEEVAKINACADLLLVHLKPDAMSRVSIPSKTFACMASGRPLLMAVAGEAAQLVKQHGCGLAVTPSDPEKLADAIREFRLLPAAEQQRMGIAGREAYLANYSSPVQIAKFEELLKQIVISKTMRRVDHRGFYRRRGKRIFDLLLVIPALVLLSPLLLVLAAIIRAKLGSPVLFRQTRPGYHGRQFNLIKFRSMVDARDAQGTLLPDEQRLTAFGKFLRSSSLDELPELWNILRGEMSFVGPRPLLREYLALYTPEQARRHDVLPGLTGWSQIHGRNAISWEKKFQFDTWYVDNLSPWIDLKILGRTLWEVLRRDGISKQGFATTDLFAGSQKKRPRIGFAGDRDIAVKVLEYLLAEGTQPELLLVAAPDRASHAEALAERCQYLSDERVMRGPSFRDPANIEMIRALDLDYIISIHFPYVYPDELLDVARGGIINLHPSFLPFGRGWHTPSWAILEECPFGATLHVVDKGVDTGEILHQLQLAVEPDDTAHSLYQRVKPLELEVFRQAWPLLREGRLARQNQNDDTAARKRRDLLSPEIQRIDLDATTTARSLLQRMRALTTDRFEEAAYFEEAGERYRVRVEFSRDTCAVLESVATTTNLKIAPSSNQPFGAWPEFDEEMLEAASRVLRSGKVNYWTGNEGREFEREYAEFVGCEHAIALANGTVALELALYSLGIGAGDEVIVPSRTFIATASSVVARGARPVCADVDRDSQTITADTIAPLITPRTKAIIPVHLAGWSCDMVPILELAESHGLAVIEDCAQAHGAEYRGRPVGSWGDMGAFSFCQDKIITTAGEGGMLVTNNAELWKKAWRYKDHGKSPDAFYQPAPPSHQFRWLHEEFGSNYRLIEVSAAIGRIMLRRLPAWSEKRREHARRLSEACQQCPGLRTPNPGPGVLHGYYKFYTFVRPERLAAGWSRDRIIQAIREQGVPCFSGSCSEIYLEQAFPLDWRPATRHAVAQELGETSLMFLVHPTLADKDIHTTCQAIERVLASATQNPARLAA